MQPPVEATAENQEVLAETQEDTETGTQEDVATQEPTSSPLAAEVDKKRFQDGGDVTQEPTSS